MADLDDHQTLLDDQPASANGDASVGEAASRRRTFAIISHPDAGKTTLTEKLLLFGGAIHMAGEVKAKGDRRRARSDWMSIEQKRGISVSTSVMTFDYGGCTFNLLDTPGHEDFSEDTYRTLTAVDSAVMVIDAAKGIEAQTLKLFEVCRLRDMPIITFINKMDREARDPFELLDEIADRLALDVSPMNWPVGMGQNFRGVAERSTGDVLLMKQDAKGIDSEERVPRLSNTLGDRVDPRQLEQLDAEMELVEGALEPFDLEAYRAGNLTPVFFGSALRTFGIRALLDQLAAAAPSPRPQPAEPMPVKPDEPQVAGFVFKVQANMDPKHRDRVAFVRICSGRFRRGMKLKMVRHQKPIAIANPIFFFAQDRGLADEAYPGDIIGVPNHGQLRIGDALCEGEDRRFVGIPSFAPEILMRVRLGDPMRAKHLKKALEDLAEEGVTQVFRPRIGADWIVGVVGQLQLDVLKSRLEAEYNLPIDFEGAPYVTARWCVADDASELERFEQAKRASLAEDRDGQPVFLARNSWDLGRIQEDFPKIRFQKTRERA